jgi:3D-(3,5/4)-trihydroxycyclohexane-1,2-dione acylhydrolase (decyclizing)
MAYEIPAALGVRMAQPKGEVYVYIGDGTYLMNPTELVTAAQENLKVTVVLSDNHGFQCIRQLQMGTTGRDFGNEYRAREKKTNRLTGEFVPLDFKKNAESMGARAWHVKTPDEVCQALREARKESRPCVIVAATEPYRYVPWSGVWWDVAAAEVSEDPVTQKLRQQYEQARDQWQRFYY